MQDQGKDAESAPADRDRVLDPVSRISEVLFGLIMALTFTRTIDVASGGGEEVRTLLVGAIGCNIAWGIVDAVMYLLNVMVERGRELMHQRALGRPDVPAAPRFTSRDWRGAVAVFLLVCLSTFPLVIPFLLFDDVQRALLASNAVAIVMLFAAGFSLARYGGLRPWATGLSMVVLGLGLVGIAIALGG
jgi:VIT1/CCC1 family predicted Fe2+/Mn2+ transporter